MHLFHTIATISETWHSRATVILVARQQPAEAKGYAKSGINPQVPGKKRQVPFDIVKTRSIISQIFYHPTKHGPSYTNPKYSTLVKLILLFFQWHMENMKLPCLSKIQTQLSKQSKVIQLNTANLISLNGKPDLTVACTETHILQAVYKLNAKLDQILESTERG